MRYDERSQRVDARTAGIALVSRVRLIGNYR